MSYLVLHTHGDKVEELVHAGFVQAHDGRMCELFSPHTEPVARETKEDTELQTDECRDRTTERS